MNGFGDDFKDFLYSFRSERGLCCGKVEKNRLAKALVACLVLTSSSVPGILFSGGEMLSAYASAPAAGEDVAPSDDGQAPEGGEVTGGATSGGEESAAQGGVFEIGSAQALIDLAAKVNNGEISGEITLQLMADIDLTGVEWVPIGREPNELTIKLNGKSGDVQYNIRNLTIKSGGNYVGLIGYCKKIEVCDLVMENITIQLLSGEYVGGLVGYVESNAKINNCSFAGNVMGGEKYAGGLIGYLNGPGEISGCSFGGEVTSLGDVSGGLLGGVTGPMVFIDSKCNGKTDQSSILGRAVSKVEVSYTGVTVEGDSVAGDNEFGIEGEEYAVKHIYYTLKGGQLEVVEEVMTEGKAGDTVYAEKKEGFTYKADKEPAESYDTSLGKKVLTMKYYDSGAMRFVDKLESNKTKARKLYINLVCCVALVVIAGAFGYKIYRKRKNNR